MNHIKLLAVKKVFNPAFKIRTSFPPMHPTIEWKLGPQQVASFTWKDFDSWNMGLRFPIWDWVAGAMTKCIVPAWLYCVAHVFDNKFTLELHLGLKSHVKRNFTWGTKNNRVLQKKIWIHAFIEVSLGDYVAIYDE